MNMQAINDFRVSHGLAPLEAKDTHAQKRRQDANKAARAQASRELKSNRSSNKGKK